MMRSWESNESQVFIAPHFYLRYATIAQWPGRFFLLLQPFGCHRQTATVLILTLHYLKSAVASQHAALQ